MVNGDVKIPSKYEVLNIAKHIFNNNKRLGKHTVPSNTFFYCRFTSVITQTYAAYVKYKIINCSYYSLNSVKESDRDYFDADRQLSKSIYISCVLNLYGKWIVVEISSPPGIICVKLEI